MTAERNHFLAELLPPIPHRTGESARWGGLRGASPALVLAGVARAARGPVLAITADSQTAHRLEEEVRFFAGQELPVIPFPDWETLPYDLFSPHPDIVSRRLETLHTLPEMERGILVLPVSTLLQRLPPRQWLQAHSLLLRVGETLDPDAMRRRLEESGYRRVSQVMEHGEYAMRGAILDLFPMGGGAPLRIDLLDDEIDSIRIFDPDSQLTVERTESVRMLPAREFPLDEPAIRRFRQRWRERFEGDPSRSVIYRDVSDGLAPAGIEYWLPLFHDTVESLFDYLPRESLLVSLEGTEEALEAFWSELSRRYEQRRHDLERPILAPSELYLAPEELEAACADHPRLTLGTFDLTDEAPPRRVNLAFGAPPPLRLQPRAAHPWEALTRHLAERPERVLLVAESAGRREWLLENLQHLDIRPRVVEGWHAFLEGEERLALTVAPLQQGLVAEGAGIEVVAEPQLIGERAAQARRRPRRARDPEQIIHDLADLEPGAPVVHEEHGVGRYAGLQRLETGGVETEFLTIEYAGGDRLYVPVASLHLISRYTGTSPENAPLHKLGGDQWARIRRRAAEKVRDVAAELLEIYSRRQASRGYAYTIDWEAYGTFAAAFPFDETPDQARAIQAVIEDMAAEKPMDRLVCGDVGFGKTEVAMRAAFIAVHGGRQVAVLVPTTLLAQQHYRNFRDRFADWPVRVEVLSRFRSGKRQERILADLAEGKVDIVIGTHKLLQESVRFRNLGLLVLDEEHRFGVRHKERLKAMRAEVDILTLTATPIPRTLNMSMSGLRDLSIIATPPTERVAIKTFVAEWNDALLTEAIERELQRGGQVYFLHNEVSSIERTADQVRRLAPRANIGIAHGQMSERELEQVMLDFYHQRHNILVCTTIIESGIDVPTANTIIINRADKLGLAQLHQLRGRVGRSHHRAYAYLLAPPRKALTRDALKRLEAIESLEDLGAGFMLATHDMEIRGAGELLGEAQSGQIQEVGFTLYNEMLERAVRDLKAGRQPQLERPLEHGPEVDLHLPALLPDDYLPDVHTRLTLYKRIASAQDDEALRELQVEMIDRFGLLPESAKALFRITALKLRAVPLGIRKIDVGHGGGRILFAPEPDIDAAKLVELLQTRPAEYRLDGPEKLRLVMDLEEPNRRFAEIENLLETLRP